MSAPLINPAPVVHRRRTARRERTRAPGGDEEAREAFDALEVFGHLREISDPEHPYTLEQVRLRRAALRPAPLRRLTRRASCASSRRRISAWTTAATR
jgi:hypothetical protein